MATSRQFFPTDRVAHGRRSLGSAGAGTAGTNSIFRRYLARPLRQDVLDSIDHADRICELIDGVLVEKTHGLYRIGYWRWRLASTCAGSCGSTSWAWWPARKEHLKISAATGAHSRRLVCQLAIGFPVASCPTRRSPPWHPTWPLKCFPRATPKARCGGSCRITSPPAYAWSGMSIHGHGPRPFILLSSNA